MHLPECFEGEFGEPVARGFFFHTEMEAKRGQAFTRPLIVN
jgi:hypothetical protein